MKRSTKILLVAGAVIALLGVVMALIAVAFAGGQWDMLSLGRDYTLEQREFSAEGITAISYDGAFRDLILLPSKDDKVHISYYNFDFDDSDGLGASVWEESGTLRIWDRDGRSHVWSLVFGVDAVNAVGTGSSATMSGAVGYREDVFKVFVYVPSQIQTITAKTSSGDIAVASLHDDTTLSLTSASGDIAVSDMILSALAMQTSSGDIEATAVGVRMDLSFSSTSGDIDLHNLAVVGVLGGETTSGDMNLTEVKSPSTVTLSSTGGDIMIDLNLGAEPYFDVPYWLELAELPAVRTLSIETASGDITLSGAIDGEASVKTLSGRIHCKGSDWEYHETERSGFSGDAAFESQSGDILLTANFGAHLMVKSASGEIRLDGCKLKSADIESASGDVSHENFLLDVERYYLLESASGDITTDGHFIENVTEEKMTERVKENLVSVKTASGNITVIPIIKN